MKQEDQQEAFISDLHKLIDHYVDEYDLTCASFLGAIEIVKYEVLRDLDTELELEEDE